MNFKNIFQNLISSTPESNYDFSLLQKNSESKYSNDSIVESDFKPNTTKIFNSMQVNLEYIKTKYNSLINSDIIIREFTLNARGKQYGAFLVYIDGMVDSNMMNDFILKPLMLKNKSNSYDGSQTRIISEVVSNNVTVRKVKKFDLIEYIKTCLIPQNALKEVSTFSEIFSGINSGNCALFIDTISIAFDIEVKGFKSRSVEKPENEIVINGPHEAFVENIRTNTSLLRRIINNEKLTIENIEIGNITRTKCAVCYIKDLTNTDLIAEVIYRLNNLEADSILSAGQLEQLISDKSDSTLPQILSTERPDKAVSYLLEGRVIVIVNGTPFALIIPAIALDFLKSPDDRNFNPILSNFIKAIRFLAACITLLLPGLYIAITSFHQEFIPTELLFSILASRSNVPFPILFEILIMEISFELIREAGLRVPSPIGPTIGIVGGIVLGQAAVSASIVSPILIIIVAITGISSFVIPDFAFGFHLRYFRFFFIFLGYMAGSLGIALGIFAYIGLLSNLKSFGVSYMTISSNSENQQGFGYFLPQIWKREYRSSFLNPQKEKKQEHISRKWRNQNY